MVRYTESTVCTDSDNDSLTSTSTDFEIGQVSRCHVMLVEHHGAWC